MLAQLSVIILAMAPNNERLLGAPRGVRLTAGAGGSPSGLLSLRIAVDGEVFQLGERVFVGGKIAVGIDSEIFGMEQEYVAFEPQLGITLVRSDHYVWFLTGGLGPALVSRREVGLDLCLGLSSSCESTSRQRPVHNAVVVSTSVGTVGVLRRGAFAASIGAGLHHIGAGGAAVTFMIGLGFTVPSDWPKLHS